MPRSFTLFCIIHGEPAPFSVQVDGDDTIDGLKNLIKARCPAAMNNIDSHYLTLWKWNQPGGAEKSQRFGPG